MINLTPFTRKANPFHLYSVWFFHHKTGNSVECLIMKYQQEEIPDLSPSQRLIG